MDPLNSSARLAREASSLDLDLLAFAPPPPDVPLDPAFLPGTTALLVAAQCYRAEAPAPAGAAPFGAVAPYCWSNFYRDLRRRLMALGERLAPGRFKVSVNGLLPEKPLAVAAGLGAYGRNTLVLTREFGSLVVLGVVAVAGGAEGTEGTEGRGEGASGEAPAAGAPSTCLGCALCVDACPTGALGRDAAGRPSLDRARCLQALSTSLEPFPGHVLAAWGARLYGCSTCQDVCPANVEVRPRRPLPERGRVGAALPLLEVLALDEAAGRARVAGNQMAARWVPWRAIRRNALLALGAAGTRAHVGVLEGFAAGPDALLAAAAAWSLGRLAAR